MNLVEFISQNLPVDYSFNITENLSYKFDKNVDNLVLKVQQGNRYQRGVIMPLSIIITSKDPQRAMTIWNEWVLTVSDRDYLEGTFNYYMIYQTPSITQVFDEISNNYYSVITVFGTIVETNNVLDIKKLEIDGVEIIINEGTYQLSSSPNSEQPSDSAYLNTSNIISSVLSLNVTTFLDDLGTLGLKFKGMRKNTTNPNSTFDVKITFTDDSIEQTNMRCTLQSIQKSRGSITTLTLNFAV